MALGRRIVNRVLRWARGRRVPVWYHEEYRLPVGTIAGTTGIEPRRADYVVWYLLDRRLIDPSDVHTPRRVRYHDMARVHTPRLLESLSDPETLGRIFAAFPGEIPVDEVMRTVRLGAGATLEAARHCLAEGGAALNLLGGFHHAEPDRAGALCPINDIAIAVAVLRSEGFSGRVVVIDLDAHPPDGTAECLAGDDRVRIGSISGEGWPGVEGIIDRRLPPDGGDDAYLAALEDLLGQLRDGSEPADLAFVLAGGDVLEGDRLGKIGISIDCARRRDLRVAEHLGDTPSVWLPGGGYSEGAWRALAGTAMALALRSEQPVPADYRPMRRHFAAIAGGIDPERLGADKEDDWTLSNEDLVDALGLPATRPRRFLNYYTTEGIEYGLHTYGYLAQLNRLGYQRLRVRTSRDSSGERLRLVGMARGAEHLLVELVLEVQSHGDLGRFLYVHWLTLMNPLAEFSDDRPQLPGQEKPGLGLVRETVEILNQMAHRLELDGVAFCPAWYHIAYTARTEMQFADPARQGRFEAMLRDLADLPLLEATKLVADGRVRMNGEPYTWEAELMVFFLDPSRRDDEAIARERERVRFTV